MRTFLETSRISPSFSFKKMLRSPRDLRNPRGFHGTTKTWEELQEAPFLYLAEDEVGALTHLANRIHTVGTTRRTNLFEVEFPDAILDEPYGLTYTGVWNDEIQTEMEQVLLRREAVIIAHYMDVETKDSLCFLVRTEFCRPVFSRGYDITMVNELPPGEIYPGSDVISHRISDLDHAYQLEPLPR